MSLPHTFKLNNGIEIPSVLYGSYKAEGDDGVDSIVYALDEAGYRGIDTALFYKNHSSVRDALKKTKIPREQITVQTKIWPTQMQDPEKWLNVALKELDTYIDVLLIHWPYPLVDGEDKKLDKNWDFVKTWKIFEKFPKDKVRSIGVSNFTIDNLKELLANTDVVPVVNQCEFHPELPQQELVDFSLQHKIIPQAYRPLGKGSHANDIVNKIAAKHNADAGQVTLSWNVQRGVIVLPKSTTPKRILSNNKLVKLDEEDLAALKELGKRNNRTCPSIGIYGYDIFK